MKEKSSRQNHKVRRELLKRKLLLLARRRPPEARGDCRRVVFTLNHELLAALIEAEHLVRQVQSVSHKGEPARQPHTPLRVHLQVRVEVAIAKRPFESARRWI